MRVEKKFYPYRNAVSILDEWFKAHPEERGLRDKVTISGLSSAIKAETPAELAQKLAEVVDGHFETELRIGREGTGDTSATRESGGADQASKNAHQAFVGRITEQSTAK